MDAVYSWVRSIVFFLLLISLLDLLLAGSGYKKYIRTYGGFILILLVISPVLSLLDGSGRLSYYLDINRFFLNTYDYSEVITGGGELGETLLLEQYQEAIAGQIEELLEKKGYTAVSVRAETDSDMESGDYGRIRGLTVTARRIEEGEEKERIVIEKIELSGEIAPTPEELSLAGYLAGYYEIEEEAVTVRIEEDGYGEEEADN